MARRKFNMDAQTTLAFLQLQTSRIEAAVYRMPMPDIRYADLIPVDTTGPEWLKTVTYYSQEGVGEAAWFNGRAQDVPNVGNRRDRAETRVQMAAIGYEFAEDEIAHASELGIDLEGDDAATARRAYEEFLDRTSLFGDASKGFVGLFKQPGLTAGTVAPVGNENGGTNSTFWKHKTFVQIGADVNDALTGNFIGTRGQELLDTLLVPYEALLNIGTRTIGAENSMTILAWLKANNIYTMTTGRELTVRGVFGLEDMGAGGTGRVMAYRRDPTVLKMHLPMPLKWLPLWRKGPLAYAKPAIFRFGGVDFRRPQAGRYLDGVC